jgi:tocopherol O-methyltransferase
VADHYDALDPFYRSVWGEHVHHGLWQTGKENQEDAVLALCRLVLARAEVKAAERVCDVGCGYGALARMIVNEYGGEVTGVTVSAAQWNYARALGAGDARQSFLLRDWLDNGLAGGSFDRVVAVESSEHIEDKKRFCAEIYRVLRPGGRFAVTAWLSRENPARWESVYLLRPICVEGRLPSMGSANEYQELFREAGFHTTLFEDLTDRARKTWTVCLGRFALAIWTEPMLRRRLFDRGFPNRVFALTILRLWLAYHTHSMRYGIFWGAK